MAGSDEHKEKARERASLGQENRCLARVVRVVITVCWRRRAIQGRETEQHQHERDASNSVESGGARMEMAF